jgi:nucleoid-associated protein YgaU
MIISFYQSPDIILFSIGFKRRILYNDIYLYLSERFPMAPDQKKNILDQAIDALTNRDELAAAAAAKAKAEADARLKAAADANAASVAAANAKAAADAKAKADADAARMKAAADENAASVAAANAKAAADAKAKADAILTTHTVVAGETLSGIALKYYGHATPEYWNKIQAANKALLDEHKGNIIAGQKLIIPKP